MFLYLEKLYETSFKLSTIPNNVSVSSESSKIYGRFKKNTKTNIFFLSAWRFSSLLPNSSKTFLHILFFFLQSISFLNIKYQFFGCYQSLSKKKNYVRQLYSIQKRAELPTLIYSTVVGDFENGKFEINSGKARNCFTPFSFGL